VLSFEQQWQYALLVGFLLNLFTWPLLHLLLFTTSWNIHLMEIAVAMVESIGYRLLMKANWTKSIVLGFLANAISYGIGEIINLYLL
jgi:hypothetical protein